MLGVTWLDGIIGRRPSVLFSYAMSIVGIVMLWLLQWYPNYWLLTGFVVCFGSMIGSRGPLLTATAMKIFRGERVGTIYGTISIGSGLGSALGSWSGGLIHDWTHSYNPLIVFSLVSVVLRDDPVPGGAGAAALDWPVCPSVIVAGREIDRVVLLAGAEFEDLAQHAGRHRRDRIDAKHRLAGRCPRPHRSPRSGPHCCRRRGTGRASATWPNMLFSPYIGTNVPLMRTWLPG